MLDHETALVFVLNRKYLRPLQVLLYSLFKHKSLRGCPIEIVTDDSMVLNDKFLGKLANNIEWMQSDSLKVFSGIKGDKVAPKLQTKFAPKYTFLKFVVFKNRGYKRHIFIDADMLCMKALDEDLLASSYDAKAMIDVSSSVFPIRDESRDNFDLDKALQCVEDASMPRPRTLDRSINSGFMVLEGRALSDTVFSSAIDIASNESFAAEQPATTEVLKRIPDMDFLELPVWYNCRRRVLESLGQDYFDSVQDKIVLLHYTPGKPWVLGDRKADFLDDLWLRWEEESLGWVEEVLSQDKKWHELTLTSQTPAPAELEASSK